MSKISKKSNEIESKSSQIIIIYKNRLSNSYNNLNYLTLQEGDLKLTGKMKNENINKHNIIKTITSLKKNKLQHSRTYGKLDKNLDLTLNKKNILHNQLNKNKSKDKIIKKIKIKKLNLNIENTKNIMLKSTDDCKDNKSNNNEREINIKNFDIASKDNNNENNNNDNITITITNNDNNTITINEKDENSLYNNINTNSARKLISQNYLNNLIDNNKILKLPINEQKSEEINLVNPCYMSDERKNEINREKSKQSEKTTKNILGSKIEHKATDIINNLKTDNEDKSKKDSIKSQNMLITENQRIKIDENEDEDEDEEYMEVEDEYDENINDDNKRKYIINFNIINNNKLNIINNYNSNNENQQENLNNELQNTNNKNIVKNIFLQQNNNNIYKTCYICDHSFNLTKMFVAECKEHYVCRKCAKIYYENLIENGVKDILCSSFKCKASVNITNLENIISEEHYIRLTRKGRVITNNSDESQNTKLKTNYSKENIQLYIKKHVIDINSNKNFFNYNREKEGYCPFCLEESLYSKSNKHYYKCLNCLSKVCKYCFKEYNERHIDINSYEYCRVFYRADEDEKNKKSKKNQLLIQYFFVFVSFYLSFAGSFYYFRKIFFALLNMNNNRNIIKYIILYFFTIICFIISFPFIFLLFPYFPSIMALCDY